MNQLKYNFKFTYFLCCLGLMTVLFTSCDCVQIIQGTIIDHSTHMPIQNAIIYKQNNKKAYSKSDKNGHFELASTSGGLSRSCPPMPIVIEHKDYTSLDTIIDNGDSVSFVLFKNK